MSSQTVPSEVVTTWPPLHDAVWRASVSQDISPLRTLLRSGADITETSDSHAWTQATILHTAADGNVELLDLLLEFGAAELLESKCGRGEEGRWAGLTVLQYAAKRGRTEVAQRLLAAGADYDVFSAVALGDLQRIERLVEQQKLLLEEADDYQSPLLHWAAASGQREVAAYLIGHGADVDARDDFDETALLVASVGESQANRCGAAACTGGAVDFLLSCDAKVDVPTAAALGDNVTLRRLLEKEPASANSSNAHGTTPLHWAARNAHVDSARLLLEFGANVDASDRIGCPPLFYGAYWAYDPAMTAFLCKSGADVGFRNIWGKGLSSYDIGQENAGIISSYRK